MEEAEDEDDEGDDQDRADELHDRPGGLRPELAAHLGLDPVVFLQLAEDLGHSPGSLADAGQGDEHLRQDGGLGVERVFEGFTGFELAGDSLGGRAQLGRPFLACISNTPNQREPGPVSVADHPGPGRQPVERVSAAEHEHPQRPGYRDEPEGGIEALEYRL